MLKIHLIPPTLESTALNTISLELWKQPDIVREIKHFYDSYNRCSIRWMKEKNWCKIREKIFEKISLSWLPDLLKQKLNETSEIMGLRIKLWLDTLITFLPRNNIPDYIHLITLNSDGGIDSRKTGASILKGVPNMEPYRSYCFACMNCLEDEVRGLWKTLPVKYKNIILGNKRGKIQGNSVSDIVIYWSCSVSQKFDVLYRRIESRRQRSDNIIDYFIQDSMWHCNSVAMEYFWEKLSEEEKRENCLNYAIKLTEMQVFFDLEVANCLNSNLVGDLIHICHFLGSEMDEIQLKEMVVKDAYRAMHFMCWCEYWQKEFNPSDSLWNFISPHHYRILLITFINSRLLYPFDSEFFVRKDRRIFRELWENTPNTMKRGFFENVADIEVILDYFIITGDVESLQLIFDDATDEERKEIINHRFSRYIFGSFLRLCSFYYRTHEDFLRARHLKKEAMAKFLRESHSDFNENRRKGNLWSLFNILYTREVLVNEWCRWSKIYRDGLGSIEW